MIKKLLVSVFLCLPITAMSDTIKLVVPVSAGGSTDRIARIIADPLSSILKTKVLVENQPGAGTAIGARYVAKSAPDGLTLMVSTVSMFMAYSTLPNPGYDPVQDFEHVITLAATPKVLVSRSDVPANSVPELVSLLKKNPNKFIFGSFSGSIDEIYVHLFNKVNQTQTIYVPYKGGTPALIDLLGGHTHLQMDNLPAVAQHVRDGKLKILAISWHNRLSQFPHIATWGELGYEDLNLSAWQGIVVPKNTPRDKIAQLNMAIAQVLKDPMVQTKLAELGFNIMSNSPEQARAIAVTTFRQTQNLSKSSSIVKQ